METGWQTGWCIISIYSDTVSVDEISRIMPVESTSTVVKGDLLSKRLNSHAPHNGWFYKKEFNDLNDVDEAMRYVAKICFEVLGKLTETKDLDVRLGCFVNSDLAQVEYEFSPETLSLLASIGKRLKIALFSWGGGEPVPKK